MASKTFLFAAVVLATVAANGAQAQLLRTLISGIVPCSVGTTTGTGTTPVFPNATVLLQCGGGTMASSTTNNNGAFSIVMDLLTSVLATLPTSNCNMVVSTPLSTCNASLPTSGTLQSPLQLVGDLLGALLNGIANLVPTGFNLVP